MQVTSNERHQAEKKWDNRGDARARDHDSIAAGPGAWTRVRHRLLAGDGTAPDSRSRLGSGGNGGGHEGRG
jgi:hypothetical protein